MITIDLHGNIRKIIGLSHLEIIEPKHNLNEVISFLKEKYASYNTVKNNELMIVINGVESSILGGLDAKVFSGDKISIISMVHGG